MFVYVGVFFLRVGIGVFCLVGIMRFCDQVECCCLMIFVGVFGYDVVDVCSMFERGEMLKVVMVCQEIFLLDVFFVVWLGCVW